ncbi:MAG: ABC transporter permease, partial [Defluviitaleaceae bacterium]|nr:ABC transporter permease [Defluviitaleaceae bacterium]
MSVIMSLAGRNLKIFWRNKPALILNLAIPFFFIFVFGEMFAIAGMDGGQQYMLAGIIAATMFESSVRVSSRTIEDMSSGFMKEVLVSPIPRAQVAIGQFVSSAIISAVQGTLILVAGVFILGYRITTPVTILWSVIAMLFIGIVFAGFGLMM